MEKESNNQNNNNSREKNKYIQIQKQYLDDSETYDSSTKYRTDISEKNNSLISKNLRLKIILQIKENIQWKSI